MEEYLRRVQSRLGAGLPEGPIHAVLGGPEPDVDTVSATLCLALHISQKQPSGGVCVPLLCRKRCSNELPEETVRYLKRVKISESVLLWREDVNLVNLHQAGKLLLTLLRDGLLENSEYHTLESSILRVVHQDGQWDAANDGALSAVTTVAREILQEAAEQDRAALGELLGGKGAKGTTPGGSNGAMKEDTHKSPDMTRLTPTRRDEKSEIRVGEYG
ncbi:hypothetical protein CHARACLAT_005739 [Characodon lateralis]|uniref:Uncharacterized protein n=1 Tax=Characodon lateralis TaxID=208331 RepID=A0ABU7EAJ8_9TELE|nr:hypothetical protein [Characodon lateralis]